MIFAFRAHVSLAVCLLLVVVYATVPGPLAAQAESEAASEPAAASEPCEGPEFRDFDYWLGTWAVYNVDGDRIGTNTISAASEGCAVLERWRPVQGPEGTSVNFYDPNRNHWEQLWVGGGGLILRLAGSAEDGVMVLTGIEPRQTPRGDVLDRISWIPEGENVRQVWEISTNSGETWQTAFQGIYRPGDSP